MHFPRSSQVRNVRRVEAFCELVYFHSSLTIFRRTVILVIAPRLLNILKRRLRAFKKRWIAFLVLSLVAGCSTESEIQTITPGVLTVAVTRAAPTDPYDAQLWIHDYVVQFAAEFDLTIEWIEVPFNQSWLLASRNEVDLVATNVASFSDRQSEGATFSDPFLYERRALRIRPRDQDDFTSINDFVGRAVGVVSGMAAERDVDRRAPDGVIIRRTNTFPELYEEFDAGSLDAIAEAEYYSLDGTIIPSHGDEIVLIDHHDLTPGEREESVFVVSDSSEYLLQAINEFIARTRFPLE